ncbi:MAG: macro domain-containing protein [Eubacteriaceae bacterium]|jgi:O-acetyl-ADP-ribose deacetylase (regulator of RNase III)|nr:macro domain-containing protein [Eubacteriaceae bacterium]
MPFLMIRNDIVRVEADAVVNPASTMLTEGRGTSRGIYLAAGEKELADACRAIGHCDIGQAVMTDGFALPAKKIIHAAAPVWDGGGPAAEKMLYDTYTAALKLAQDSGLGSIAFPLLSTGSNGFPHKIAFKTAVSAITGFLLDSDLLVYLVLYDKTSLEVSKSLTAMIDEHIDDDYVSGKDESYRGKALFGVRNMVSDSICVNEANAEADYDNLRKLMGREAETFSEMLFRLIDEKGLTDPEVYHRANLDRRLFSKIRNSAGYQPGKRTVAALAVALELSLDEAVDLLGKAGYAFTDASKFDRIVSFYIKEGEYDIFTINEALFYFDQRLLGQ